MDNTDVQVIANKKKYLKRYRKNVACINRLENKLRDLDDRITKVKTPTLSGMPRGGVPVTIDELISDKIELENRIKRLRQKNKKVRAEVLEEIDSLDDPRYCEVLESYLIECRTLEEIAESECYTVRHVYRLYCDAIAQLTVT